MEQGKSSYLDRNPSNLAWAVLQFVLPRFAPEVLLLLTLNPRLRIPKLTAANKIMMKVVMMMMTMMTMTLAVSLSSGGSNFGITIEVNLSNIQ